MTVHLKHIRERGSRFAVLIRPQKLSQLQRNQIGEVLQIRQIHISQILFDVISPHHEFFLCETQGHSKIISQISDHIIEIDPLKFTCFKNELVVGGSGENHHSRAVAKFLVKLTEKRKRKDPIQPFGIDNVELVSDKDESKLVGEAQLINFLEEATEETHGLSPVGSLVEIIAHFLQNLLNIPHNLFVYTCLLVSRKRLLQLPSINRSKENNCESTLQGEQAIKYEANHEDAMVGLISNPFTIRDVGHAVVGILRELPGLVVQTVRLANALDAMKVNCTSHSSAVSPLEFQEVIKMIQLLF